MATRSEYGTGHPEFLKYTLSIVSHEAYGGMPDAYTDKGHVQWEAPSNRQSGKHRDTYQRRLEWWRRKAAEIGIDPNSGRWISRTAKAIHPTKTKPCKRCGRVMDLRYAYPSSLLIRRLAKRGYQEASVPPDRLEHVTDMITRMHRCFGSRVLDDLPTLLDTGGISSPQLGADLNAWLRWLEDHYMPAEPPTLSPGAMSNAPDRFDGFHSFNLCCRSEADSGRHIANLRSYVTDRRVFEYWNSGDWIAADRLMGEIRARLRDELCFNGHPGPCSADHVGPLSLGFAHRPEFQILCGPCNSAKNNRMTLRDVMHLRKAELAGQIVTSWYNNDLWQMRSHDVVSEETALRLSKLLRDNRHMALSMLYRFLEAGYFSFLLTFLSLEAAEYNVEFVNLRVEQHITCFDRVVHTPRHSRYAGEQKARRVRIALESLLDYFTKDNRNVMVLPSTAIKKELDSALVTLKQAPAEIIRVDNQIAHLLSSQRGTCADSIYRDTVDSLPSPVPAAFTTAKQSVTAAMAVAAHILSSLWTDERYLRADLDAADQPTLLPD